MNKCLMLLIAVYLFAMIGLACGDSYRFDCPRDCWVEYDTAKERCVSPFEIVNGCDGTGDYSDCTCWCCFS